MFDGWNKSNVPDELRPIAAALNNVLDVIYKINWSDEDPEWDQYDLSHFDDSHMNSNVLRAGGNEGNVGASFNGSGWN